MKRGGKSGKNIKPNVVDSTNTFSVIQGKHVTVAGADPSSSGETS